MKIDYVESSLFNYGNEYLNDCDKEEFNKKYFGKKNISYENVKEIDKFQDKYIEYLSSLNENELIIFFDKIFEKILSKEYMSDLDKANNIYKVLCNGLYGYIEEEHKRFSNFNLLKQYFYKIWDFICELSGNDEYILERKIHYKHKIYQIYKGLSNDEYNKKIEEKFGNTHGYTGRYKWYGDFLD